MQREPFLAAAVQLTSTSDENRNWEEAKAFVREAAGRGARFIATPENTNFLGPHDEKVHMAEPLDGETCARFSRLAGECDAFLLLGSFNERSDEADRCHNTSVLFSPAGERLAVYRKMHLFDIDLSKEVSFQESTTIKPGDEPVSQHIGRFPRWLILSHDDETYDRLRKRYGGARTPRDRVTPAPGGFRSDLPAGFAQGASGAGHHLHRDCPRLRRLGG